MQTPVHFFMFAILHYCSVAVHCRIYLRKVNKVSTDQRDIVNSQQYSTWIFHCIAEKICEICNNALLNYCTVAEHIWKIVNSEHFFTVALLQCKVEYIG